MSDPVRWMIPAVLLISLAGTPLAVWWERRRPTSYVRRSRTEAANTSSRTTRKR